MSSKGQSTTNQQQAQTQTTTPAGAPQTQLALTQAQNAAQLPFNIPQAPVAGFSQDQQTAFGNVNAAQGMAQPYYNTAANYYSPQGAAAFYNPAVDAVTAQLQNIFGQQNSQNTGNLVQSAGGVGADRVGVGQANMANQQGLAAGQTYSNLWNSAVQQSQAAGAGEANLGTASQNAALSGANAQLTTGGLQQQLAQAQLNSPYQQQLAQAAFPYQQAQFLAGITGALTPGLGSTTSGTSNTAGNATAAPPSIFSQLLGAGTLGVGAYNAFGGTAPTTADQYGGGSAAAGDAYGGSQASPLPGLSPSDYGAARGGRVDPYAQGGPVRPPLPVNPYPIIVPPARNDNQPPMFSRLGPAGANDNGEKHAEGGTVSDEPIDVSKQSIIPDVKLQPTQVQTPQLNFAQPQAAAPSSSGSSAMGDVANIAKIAMMFAKRGGRIEAKNPYAFAEGGDVDDDEPIRMPDAAAMDAWRAGVDRDRGLGMQATSLDGTPSTATAFAPTSGDASSLPPEIAAGASANAYAPTGAKGVSRPSQALVDRDPVDPNLGKRDTGLAGNPWTALMAAGLGIMGGSSPYAGVNIGQGGLQGIKMLEAQRAAAQKDETTDQATRRLDQEAKFHEDSYNRLTAAQKLPYTQRTLAQQDALDAEKYAPAGTVMTKDGLHPAFYEQRTAKVIDGITGKPPEATDHVIPKGGSRNSPEEIQGVVDGIKNGTQPPTLTGLYGDSIHVRAGLSQAGFDLGKAQLEWKQANALTQSVNSGRMVQYVGLNKSVDRTIDEVKSLADQLQQGGVPMVNKLELMKYIQTQGNTPMGQLATQYMTSVNTLREEFANLANGGYAPTEAAWKLANEQVNGDFGVKQMHASLNEIQRLIRYRLQAVPGLATQGPSSPNRYTGQGQGQGAAAAPSADTIEQNGFTYHRQPDGSYRP